MDQKDLWQLQMKLVPDLNTILQKRYRILQVIKATEPVGRRALADMLKMTERTIRNETVILKQEGLIEIKQTGMICTNVGEKLIEGLRDFIYNLSGLYEKETKLAQKLGIRKVLITENITEDTATQLSIVGRMAAEKLMLLINEEDIIAVTGGKSVAVLAPFLMPLSNFSTVQFVAARGGLVGSTLSTQANTIAFQFSQQCNATPKLLFVPENLSQESYDAIREEPVIKEVTSLYDKVNIVVHGIGEAIEMAQRRNASEELISKLREKGAVAEAFGYYFNEKGEVVHQIATIGIHLEQVKKANHLLAIATGKTKAEAIAAYLKNGLPQTTLVLDEKTADEIINLG